MRIEARIPQWIEVWKPSRARHTLVDLFLHGKLLDTPCYETVNLQFPYGSSPFHPDLAP